MAVESIHTQIRELPSQPKLDSPEIIEKLRHGNIYEVLRSQISPEDFNKFISYRGRLFENSILQNYQVYADAGSIPPPDLEMNFASHNMEMGMSGEERQFFAQEMAQLQNFEPMVEPSGRVHLQARAMSTARSVQNELPQGAGEDVAGIAEGALTEWEDFFGELQNRVMDAQMIEQMRSKGEELNREMQRVIALVMSGQADPEYILIAAAKSNMAQNGIMFSHKGKKIMQLNEQLNSYAKDLYTMDPNSQGYMRELQMAQSKTRSGSQTLQMEMMDLQRVAQNVATSIEFASNAVRTFAQMRTTPTQAIAARG